MSSFAHSRVQSKVVKSEATYLIREAMRIHRTKLIDLTIEMYLTMHFKKISIV